MSVEIPKLADGDHSHSELGNPGWAQPVRKGDDGAYVKLKPIIRCTCGYFCGIALHHVHADGTVTASFFHSSESDPGRGCGWHVFLKLKDYDGGEFPPNP